MRYQLHYAPDNASIIVRLALTHSGLPYDTILVDRKTRQQTSQAFRTLNPHGLIPVLETPDGPLFETGAILLWLVDRHAGLGPQMSDPDRGSFLKWLFSFANTLHPALRMMFYPDVYIKGEPECAALREGTRRTIASYLDRLELVLQKQPGWLGSADPTVADFYLAAMLRWMALYPQGGTSWFNLAHWPALLAFAQRRDKDSATSRVAQAEGLGPTPFSAPHYPDPPEGSAL